MSTVRTSHRRATRAAGAALVIAACAQVTSSPKAENPADSRPDASSPPSTPPPAVDAAVPGSDAGDASGPCGCGDYAPASPAGTLSGALTETSGLAASRRNRGVLYAHNDSGDAARVFAVDLTGKSLGEIAFGGATAVDWEDIAVGPCGGSGGGGSGQCVWVGDVGNNSESRTDLALYAIDEPALDGRPFANQTIAARRYPFSYPDGNFDCEALLVHPTSAEIVVVTKKASGEAGVYRFPQPLVPGAPVTLQRVGSAKGTLGKSITGGDVSPCGDRLLLRAYFGLLEYSLSPGGTVGAALGADPRNVPMALELQSEAVAYRADGRGYFTAPEGSSAVLSFVGCKD